MKAPFLVLFFFPCLAFSQLNDYPIKPVSFTDVDVTGGFWKPRLDTVSKVTIPYAFKKCEETGRVNNFIFAAGIKEGQFKGDYGFDDSDVYKILEGCFLQLNDPG